MRLTALFIILLVFSCSPEPGKEVEQRKAKEPARLDADVPTVVKEDDNDSTLNEMDTLGRKIGKWETKVDGEVWKTEFFKDGQLHGLQTQKLNNGELLETNFSNGKKNGISQQYPPGAKVASYLTIYSNNKRVFSTFPFEILNGNFKKVIYSTELDSIELNIRYLKGMKLYKGTVLKKSSIKGVPTGIHEVYYENGKVKFQLDFEKDTLYTFDRKGNPTDTSFFSYEKKVWPKFDEVEISNSPK